MDWAYWKKTIRGHLRGGVLRPGMLRCFFAVVGFGVGEGEKNGKTLKTVKGPKADASHPLLSGGHELIAAFANSNYKDPSEVSFGD